MKKITFILFALIAGTTFAQDGSSASTTAQALAEIVSPISIDKVNNLSFGRIIASQTAGDVTIDPVAETIVFGNDNMKDPSNQAFSPASFTITAANTYSYGITITGSSTLTATTVGSTSTPMDITYSAALDGTSIGLTETASGGEEDQVLTIGGVLSVNGSQGEDDYSGTITVDVAYN